MITTKLNFLTNIFIRFLLKSSFTLPPISELPSVVSLISDIFIPESDVFSELSLLDTSKTMGIDNIGPKILKFCAPALYLPIHHLFSLSLSSQRLPTEWCTHSITPIFKSGDRASTKNYRPISLLCTISKFLKESYTSRLYLLSSLKSLLINLVSLRTVQPFISYLYFSIMF